jgi:hypothetical protein
MKLWQIGCLGVVILVVGLFIYLAVLAIIQSIKDKKFIAELMRRNNWRIIEKPEEVLKKWVKTELNSAPERYTVFGEVRESYFFSSTLLRDRMYISNLWTKQDGNKIYFVLNVSDHYSQGKGGHSVKFTIIGMRAPQMSLPFFTLFPRMEFPKQKGWRFAISVTHDLKIDEPSTDVSNSSYHDPRLRQPLEMPKILAEETPAPRPIDPPITFDSKQFNERYELYGKEASRLRQFFDNEKLTALESMPQTFVDAGGELIFVYIPEHKPKTEDFEKYVNEGIATINTVSRDGKMI